MNDEELGPKPDPVVEEKEPNPGGVDALPEDANDEVLAHDLDPTANPADAVVPDELTEPDTEKKQAPDGDEGTTEPPA
jgi:hypothetical protein